MITIVPSASSRPISWPHPAQLTPIQIEVTERIGTLYKVLKKHDPQNAVSLTKLVFSQYRPVDEIFHSKIKPGKNEKKLLAIVDVFPHKEHVFILNLRNNLFVTCATILVLLKKLPNLKELNLSNCTAIYKARWEDKIYLLKTIELKQDNQLERISLRDSIHFENDLPNMKNGLFNLLLARIQIDITTPHHTGIVGEAFKTLIAINPKHLQTPSIYIEEQVIKNGKKTKTTVAINHVELVAPRLFTDLAIATQSVDKNSLFAFIRTYYTFFQLFSHATEYIAPFLQLFLEDYLPRAFDRLLEHPENDINTTVFFGKTSPHSDDGQWILQNFGDHTTTILAMACRMGAPLVLFKVLFQYPINVNTRHPDGTPLDLLQNNSFKYTSQNQASSYEKIRDLLLENGAKTLQELVQDDHATNIANLAKLTLEDDSTSHCCLS